jgi:hypothetical protein
MSVATTVAMLLAPISMIVTLGPLRRLLARFERGPLSPPLAAGGDPSSPPEPVDSTSQGTAAFNASVKTATFLSLTLIGLTN